MFRRVPWIAYLHQSCTTSAFYPAFIYMQRFIISRHLQQSSKQAWLTEALTSVEIMQLQGMAVSRDLAYQLVYECTKQQDLDLGRRVQSIIAHDGLDSIAALTDHFVRLFSFSENLVEANKAFSSTSKPSLYTWSAIIAAHAKSGKGEMALEFYNTMEYESINPDKFTYSSILKACGNVGAIEQGRQIHDHITKVGLQSDIVVGTALVDMYAKSDDLEEARRIFDQLKHPDLVAFSSMITGYIQHDKATLALECFDMMIQKGLKPNEIIFAIILKACSSIDIIEQGRSIHGQILRAGIHSRIVGSALVDMYAKCGSLEEAREIFDQLPDRDVVTWGAMISGYAQHGEGLIALHLFERMQLEHIKPDKAIFLSVLKACVSIGAIEKGRQVHKQIIENGFQCDIVVGNTIVDMYVKCGKFDDACEVFNGLPNRDIVTWGAIITGYAQRGKVEEANQCLEDMQLQGIKPDEVVFATILAACSHAGLVDMGFKFLKAMIGDHFLVPDDRHYNCMVDLLGRAGYLDEAESLLQLMEPNFNGWTALLAACKTYGNVGIARRSFDQVVNLNSHHASAYVLMSGIFSDAHMWKDAARIEGLRKQVGAWKRPAKAWIELNEAVHEFIVGDKSHPESEEIYAMLKRLSDRMKESGYAPKVDLVLQQMSDQDKEDALCGHCEKLAVAFGLIKTPPGAVIQVRKNLRVCVDCHSATKIISKIEKRDIIIRDGYRMHHFKDGSCSCEDYH